MGVTTIAHECKQRWILSICNAVASFLLIITTLMGPFSLTSFAYASNHLLTLLPTRGSTSSATKAIFYDDFEKQKGLTSSGVWRVSYPSCRGTGRVTVDHTVAHSGKTSIRVNGRGGYCNHVFIGLPNAFKGFGTNLYVRLFLRLTNPLPSGHIAFVAMKDINDGGKDLRMGGQNRALQWNRESDDATLPAQSPAGVALSRPVPTNQWECIEFNINEGRKTMSTWLNGIQVKGLHLDNVPTQDVDSEWLNRSNWQPALADLRLGWESYGGGDDTLWFDDVAISSQRIGCGTPSL
jgi:hypothetical protein